MEVEADVNRQVKKSKKKKANKDSLNVTIEVQSEQPGKLAPLVGYFPTGYIPNSDESEVKIYRNQQKTKRLELVVSPTGSKVQFVGCNYSGEAAAGRMCSYALGILDKESQKLKIVPVAANKVFRLEPRLRRDDVSDKDPITPAVGEVTAQDRAAQISKLITTMGTSNAKKRIQKASRLRQKEDPTTQQGMDELLEDATIDKEALTSTSAQTTGSIPPHDLSATKPEMAYPLDQIIPKGEWDYLGEILHTDVDPKSYPSFVCNRVYKLDIIKDEEEKRKFAGILSYISHLVSFKDRFSLNSKSSSKDASRPIPIPSMLLQKFTKMFVDENRKRLADDKIDTLISYVLVLTLFADDFQSDITDIASDLKMSTLKLRNNFVNLGCKLRSVNKRAVATLPVPLVFQGPRKRKNR